jgi:hypothetical protein
MAQLISFNNSIGGFPMPHVPAFQFWATRTLTITRASNQLGNQPVLPQPQTFHEAWEIVCIANTSHAANHKTVTVSPFGPSFDPVTFELTESTHTGSNVPVAITDGDGASAVALALATAIEDYFESHYPDAFAAAPAGAEVDLFCEDPGLRLYVTTGFASGGAAPALVATRDGGVMYGEGFSLVRGRRSCTRDTSGPVCRRSRTSGPRTARRSRWRCTRSP